MTDQVRLAVGHYHPVGHSGCRRLQPHLPVDVVRAEERHVHARVARPLDRGVHLARPVLVVADREQTFLGHEKIGVRVQVHVGRVLHIEAA